MGNGTCKECNHSKKQKKKKSQKKSINQLPESVNDGRRIPEGGSQVDGNELASSAMSMGENMMEGSGDSN